jgi:integrase
LRVLEQPNRRARPLSNGSINKTLKTLSQVADDAIDYGHMASNPARGKKRRLKAAKPRRTWLKLEEVSVLLDGAKESRALLATMILAGLRVGSCVRWRAVDLARGLLTVEEAKTDAGTGRVIDVSPMLRVDALIRGADWAVMGSNGVTPDDSLSVPATENPAVAGLSEGCGARTRTLTT